MDLLPSSIFTDWILLITLFILLIYVFGTRNFTYFSKQKIPFAKPTLFLGNLGPVLLRKMSFPLLIERIYTEFKDKPYCGVFNFSRPIAMLIDPELIKTITLKDFDHFVDHEVVIGEKEDIVWGKGIFNLKGQKWRDMRATLTPAFTSSKMKIMFVLIEECGKQLGDFLGKCCQNFKPDKIFKIEKEGDLLAVEMKDILTRFTNDVIATVAFGLGVDSLMAPSNKFYRMGKYTSVLGNRAAFIFLGYMLFPSIMKMLNIKLIPGEGATFFKSLILDTMTTRDRENIVRPDLIQLLMQAKKGTLKDEDNSSHNLKSIFDDDDFVAQAFMFFLAGFETTSTNLCFLTQLLSTHPDIQSRLQEEIESTLQLNGGKVSYEAVQNMKYLDMVISEALRLYPPVAVSDRCCTKKYTLPVDPPLQLSTGDVIWIPTYAVHRNPDNFPEPDKFDPERFSDENKHNIKPYTYLPFGSGPRSCIGNRFAMLVTKVALVHLLTRFNLCVVSKSPVPLQLSKKEGFNMTVDGGFWLGLQERSK